MTVWPDGQGPPVLLDGHNRQEICAAHNLPFDLVVVSLASREDALRWIINHQLGRRNLTGQQVSYLRGQRYNLEKRGEAQKTR